MAFNGEGWFDQRESFFNFLYDLLSSACDSQSFDLVPNNTVLHTDCRFFGTGFMIFNFFWKAGVLGYDMVTFDLETIPYGRIQANTSSFKKLF